MRKTKDEKLQIKKEKLSTKEISIETMKGFCASLAFQLVAKILLIILESENFARLIENCLKWLSNSLS